MQNGNKSSDAAEPSQEAIAKRAYELFLQRGSIPGFELDDWLQAEAELVSSASVRKSRSAPAPAPARTRSSSPSTR